MSEEDIEAWVSVGPRDHDRFVEFGDSVVRGTSKVHITLIDIRADNPICISYDLERDGWVVEQNSDPEDALSPMIERAFIGRIEVDEGV